MNKNFKNQYSNESITTKIQAFLKGNRLIIRSILPPKEASCPGFGVRAHLSNYTGRTLRILAPFHKLNANCRNIRSMVFFIICGNRALYPLSCRWLIPKYCSTMYRYFKMALFLVTSKSVSFALTLSFRMIPSRILFKARNSRLGAPA